MLDPLRIVDGSRVEDRDSPSSSPPPFAALPNTGWGYRRMGALLNRTRSTLKARQRAG